MCSSDTCSLNVQATEAGLPSFPSGAVIVVQSSIVKPRIRIASHHAVALQTPFYLTLAYPHQTTYVQIRPASHDRGNKRYEGK